jgi:outer membrane protein OmpA-like peptidoglycan-associated protein
VPVVHCQLPIAHRPLMKPFLKYSFLILSYHVAYSQNLVPNGGFEDENICTEYIKNCAPEAWIATSLYANYYFDAAIMEHTVAAHGGTHYLGITAGSLGMAGIRNFVRARLLCGLQEGHQYKLVMFVHAEASILDSIGIYFSEQDYLCEKRYFRHIVPQLWSRDGMKASADDTPNWKKVELLYTANGNEGFITIGNYKRIDYKGIYKTYTRSEYYFFVDDVSLTPVDSTEKLCAQVDSVKSAIYLENERHSILDRKIYALRRQPPAIIPLPKTEKKRFKIQKIDTLVIPDIFFATASYELSPVSFNLLDSFANKIATYNVDSMIVEGHTDSIGKLAYNENLSRNRAMSVKNYLTNKVAGLDVKSISRGFAYLRPVAGNSTPKGRQMNRRVEIILYRNEEL